uniref:Ig-like domain-containing protein n=1 Tax=Roseihalotalea indica TaxID=2867963 RepID=A0AA49JF03_9BACT|nr:Ig-like domain-containing protein [Tunicatimonas sp. TK19036]
MIASTKYKIWYILLLLPWLTGTVAQAQFNTDYWMPPVWESRGGGSATPTELLITTAYPKANYTVMLANGLPVSIGQVKRGVPVTVTLDTIQGMTFVANTVEDSKGLLVRADYPVQVVYRNTSGNNQCLVPLKGQSGLGTEFRAGSQTRIREGSYGANDLHFISVMATQNNTHVTITAPREVVFFGGASTVNITLNKHQTYLVRNATSAGDGADNKTNNLVGSHIESDKPIAVISGGQHLRYVNSGNADAGIDQLVPVHSEYYEIIGNQYILVRGGTESQSGTSTDYALIVGAYDNTKVFINGISTPVATIDAGEVFEYILPGGPEEIGVPYLIETSEKAFVYHVSGLRQHEVGMSAVPSINCTGSNYLEFVRFGGNDNYIHIIAPDAAFATPTSLTINDDPYTTYDESVQTVPGNVGWKTISFSYGTGEPEDIIVKSQEFFHLGVIVGGSQGGTYGYLSGFPRKIDVLDPVNLLPTTRYVVDTLDQGSSISHCLNLQSCNDQYQIKSIISSANTGRVQTLGEAGQSMDTCLRYTARTDFLGNDTIRVNVSNAEGITGTVELVFHVTRPVKKPLANNDTLEVTQNSLVEGNVLNNDQDLQFSNGIGLVSQVQNGSLTLASDGTFTYQPNMNFLGVDSFEYQLCSIDEPSVCVKATVILNVEPPRTSPEARGATFQLDSGETRLENSLISFVTDPVGEGLTFSLLTDVIQGELSLEEDGTFRYIAPEGYGGTDMFTYEVCDRGELANCTEGTVTIDIVFDENLQDTDGDGILDGFEKGDDPENPLDTDQDGVPDYEDTDSDNDGLPDWLEARGEQPPIDTDQDGLPDYRDLDSDNDGIPDSYQSLLTIYEGFTPDGDGINDIWVIEGIENFPDNNVQVFNRWGNRVFQAKGYNNQEVAWGSQITGGFAFGDTQVPSGTYFYLISLNNGKQPISGYVIVNR